MIPGQLTLADLIAEPDADDDESAYLRYEERRVAELERLLAAGLDEAEARTLACQHAA